MAACKMHPVHPGTETQIEQQLEYAPDFEAPTEHTGDCYDRFMRHIQSHRNTGAEWSLQDLPNPQAQLPFQPEDYPVESIFPKILDISAQDFLYRLDKGLATKAVARRRPRKRRSNLSLASLLPPRYPAGHSASAPLRPHCIRRLPSRIGGRQVPLRHSYSLPSCVMPHRTSILL